MDDSNRNWEGGSTREAEWRRERERWSNPSNRPDWAQFGGGYPGGLRGGPESGEWREGFRGGFGNSGQLSRAAYNRGGFGAGYDELGGSWGGEGPIEFGPRGGWGTGFEGRGYQAEFGGPGPGQNYGSSFGPGYGHQANYFASAGPASGFERGNWGGGRAQEGTWSERGFNPRGQGGGFAGREYDWTRRGEQDRGANLQGGGWGGGFASSSSEGPYTGRGPQGYQRSDERVYEEVCDRLTEHGQLDATNIQVRCAGGEITLEGSVSDRRSKRLAEEIAESARGVRDVHNRLRVSASDRGEETTGARASERVGPSEKAARGRR
jgi:hypothetical protein